MRAGLLLYRRGRPREPVAHVDTAAPASGISAKQQVGKGSKVDDIAAMTDDKRTEQIKLTVSERMALDLLRAATFADRNVADWIYQVLRRELYGHVGLLERASQRAPRDQ